MTETMYKFPFYWLCGWCWTRDQLVKEANDPLDLSVWSAQQSPWASIITCESKTEPYNLWRNGMRSPYRRKNKALRRRDTLRLWAEELCCAIKRIAESFKWYNFELPNSFEFELPWCDQAANEVTTRWKLQSSNFQVWFQVKWLRVLKVAKSF